MAVSFSGTTQTIGMAGNNLLEKVWTRKKRPKAMWGIAPFGFATLDMLTGGIQRGWLIFLGARPQVGKSVLAGQVALTVARHFDTWTNRIREVVLEVDEYGDEVEVERLVLDEAGEPIYKPREEWEYVKIITLEMSAETYLKRIACGDSRIPAYKIDSGVNLSDEEAARFTEVVTELQSLPIVFWDKQASIKAVEAFLKDRNMLTGFWILDHIGLFKDVKDNQNFKTGAMGNASNACMDMAHDIAPGMVIAHMNRASESNADKKPTLANFSGADDISKDADLALGVHRPWMFTDVSEEEKSGVQPAELLMLKTRHCPSWNIQMLYNPKLTKFVEAPDLNNGAKILVQ
jgi:replicative DNA helicase